MKILTTNPLNKLAAVALSAATIGGSTALANAYIAANKAADYTTTEVKKADLQMPSDEEYDRFMESIRIEAVSAEDKLAEKPAKEVSQKADDVKAKEVNESIKSDSPTGPPEKDVFENVNPQIKSSLTTDKISEILGQMASHQANDASKPNLIQNNSFVKDIVSNISKDITVNVRGVDAQTNAIITQQSSNVRVIGTMIEKPSGEIIKSFNNINVNPDVLGDIDNYRLSDGQSYSFAVDPESNVVNATIYYVSTLPQEKPEEVDDNDVIVDDVEQAPEIPETPEVPDIPEVPEDTEIDDVEDVQDVEDVEDAEEAPEDTEINEVEPEETPEDVEPEEDIEIEDVGDVGGIEDDNSIINPPQVGEDTGSSDEENVDDEVRHVMKQFTRRVDIVDTEGNVLLDPVEETKEIKGIAYQDGTIEWESTRISFDDYIEPEIEGYELVKEAGKIELSIIDPEGIVQTVVYRKVEAEVTPPIIEEKPEEHGNENETPQVTERKVSLTVNFEDVHGDEIMAPEVLTGTSFKTGDTWSDVEIELSQFSVLDNFVSVSGSISAHRITNGKESDSVTLVYEDRFVETSEKATQTINLVDESGAELGRVSREANYINTLDKATQNVTSSAIVFDAMPAPHVDNHEALVDNVSGSSYNSVDDIPTLTLTYKQQIETISRQVHRLVNYLSTDGETLQEQRTQTEYQSGVKNLVTGHETWDDVAWSDPEIIEVDGYQYSHLDNVDGQVNVVYEKVQGPEQPGGNVITDYTQIDKTTVKQVADSYMKSIPKLGNQKYYSQFESMSSMMSGVSTTSGAMGNVLNAAKNGDSSAMLSTGDLAQAGRYAEINRRYNERMVQHINEFRRQLGLSSNIIAANSAYNTGHLGLTQAIHTHAVRGHARTYATQEIISTVGGRGRAENAYPNAQINGFGFDLPPEAVADDFMRKILNEGSAYLSGNGEAGHLINIMRDAKSITGGLYIESYKPVKTGGGIFGQVTQHIYNVSAVDVIVL